VTDTNDRASGRPKKRQATNKRRDKGLSDGWRPAARRGFSLIEVLVALAILGIALGALMPRLSLGTLASERAERTEAAVVLAERLLAEAGRTIPMPTRQPIDGSTPDGFSWHLETCCLRTVSNTTRQNVAGIVDLRAEVSWRSMRGTQSIAVIGRRMLPGESR
jgi:general secretion pathway protein I